MGGLRGQRGRWGHWGRSCLKYGINVSGGQNLKKKISLFKKLFFFIESLIMVFKNTVNSYNFVII
ncbi:MAG: hypothetical protein LBB88_10195 [Planctomycetaceae bacterium]|nr:hypothetical protein [Planctomycetaceae bacterium]